MLQATRCQFASEEEAKDVNASRDSFSNINDYSISDRSISFVATHTAMTPVICALIITVHPAALIGRVYEVPWPVRVCSAGGLGEKWD